MKSYWVFLLTFGLMTLGASGQTGAGVSGSASGNASASAGKSGVKTNANAGASASANNAAAGLSSGTTMQTELTKSLDTRKAKPGDEVTARVTQDVKSDGKVVVPKGSRLVGHVTEARARTSESSESRLGISFDHAVLKDGQQVAFSAVVQALAPPVDVAASAMNDDSAGISGNARSAGGTRSSGGGGLGGVVGGPTSAVGGTVGAVGNTAGSVAGSTTGAVGATVNSTTGVAARGVLNSSSQGVIGLQGLNLNSATSGNAQASVISSTTQNVKLDTGTQMLLQVRR